jgi:hypothetical protein
MANAVDALVYKRAADVLRDTDRDSVGVVRLLSKRAGEPALEREYELGDEALVESGQAEWVVAPVHLPSAGRRLDHDAEREALPLDGVEVYPPAEPTSAARRAESRVVGHVEASSADDVAAQIASKRTKIAREDAGQDGDAALQAELGGHGARSGPVTAQSDLPSAEEASEDVAAKDTSSDSADTSRGSTVEKPAAARTAPAKSTPASKDK